MLPPSSDIVNGQGSSGRLVLSPRKQANGGICGHRGRPTEHMCSVGDPLSLSSPTCIFVLLILFLFYYSCPNFSLFALLCPPHPLLPQSVPTLLSMFMGHSYMFLDYLLPLPSLLVPLPLFLDRCQCVPCLHASGSVLPPCLFPPRIPINTLVTLSLLPSDSLRQACKERRGIFSSIDYVPVKANKI